MAVMIEVTEIEATAREMIDTVVKRDWENTNRIIIMGNVFKAQYWAALSADRIIAVGEALTNMTFSEGRKEEIRAELTKLCRAKVLRSRMGNGKRLYEMNY